MHENLIIVNMSEMNDPEEKCKTKPTSRCRSPFLYGNLPQMKHCGQRELLVIYHFLIFHNLESDTRFVSPAAAEIWGLASLYYV